MVQIAANTKDVPLKMVGGTDFGRFAKISLEQTWNMIVTKSDDTAALVPFAGYNQTLSIAPQGTGRGIFSSVRLGCLVTVINDSVFIINSDFVVTLIGIINTTYGDVFIDEND